MDSEAWLIKLISFDTTSRNSNKALIDYICDVLDTQKLMIRLTYDATHTKANLFVTLPAAHDECNGGLILSGHTDVVPVDGQQWDTGPFTATKIADRIYGRGACDMKGFLAVILSLLPRFLQLKLRKPLHLAFSYDEEVGCLGAPLMIKDFQSQGIQPGACIVGEPTMMQPVIAHKGINSYTCKVHGMPAHSSLTPQACNAIEHAATLISEMRRYAQQLKHEHNDPLFDVPFTTLTNNVIHGGTANNIVPEWCEFNFEFRNLPQMDPEMIIHKIKQVATETILPKMREECPTADIQFIKKAGVPAFESSAGQIVELAKRIRHEAELGKVSYATEAGLFQQSGIATVLCGPGSIEQAHRPNEFVAVAQLALCEEFLYQFVNGYCVN